MPIYNGRPSILTNTQFTSPFAIGGGPVFSNPYMLTSPYIAPSGNAKTTAVGIASATPAPVTGISNIHPAFPIPTGSAPVPVTPPITPVGNVPPVSGIHPTYSTPVSTAPPVASAKTIDGTLGRDFLYGGDGDDVIHGFDGDDRLYGYAGNDTLYGDAGDDILEGGAGADVIDGGAGVDTLNYVHSGAGVSITLFGNGYGMGRGGDAEGDQFYNIENVWGSNKGGDRLSGNIGDNILYGLGGDDTLDGGAGADTLDGGTGVDCADYSNSKQGVYVNLEQGHGERGDAEGDILRFIEDIRGSRDVDDLVGNSEKNFLYGNDGNDWLRGLGGNDILDGGAGDDRLVGGEGADTLIGGDGWDSVSYYYQTTSGVIIDLLHNIARGGDADGDTFYSIENITGTDCPDSITGDATSNQLLGLDGNDIINGGAGDDYLTGGIGADELDGGTGNDTLNYYLSVGAVTIVLDATGSGIGTGGDAAGDRFKNIENVYGSDAGADKLTGNAGDNRLSGYGNNDTIIGGAGNDILDGGDGDDLLAGGMGADTLIGGNGIDTVDYRSSRAGVTVNLAMPVVHSNPTAAIGGDAAGDTFVSIENIYGSSYADVLTGHGGDNALYGFGGDDVLNGGDGNDILDGGAGADTLNGGLGVDALIGGAGGDILHGGAGDDKLIGGTGSDRLDGGDGSDILIGGEENIGGNGNDIIIILDGTGSDSGSGGGGGGGGGGSGSGGGGGGGGGTNSDSTAGLINGSHGDAGADIYVIATSFDKSADKSIAINTTVQLDGHGDRIDVSDLRDASDNSVLDFTDILRACSDNGSNIRLDLSQFRSAEGYALTGALIIDGVGDNPAALHASDFIFSNGANWENMVPHDMLGIIG